MTKIVRTFGFLYKLIWTKNIVGGWQNFALNMALSVACSANKIYVDYYGNPRQSNFFRFLFNKDRVLACTIQQIFSTFKKSRIDLMDEYDDSSFIDKYT